MGAEEGERTDARVPSNRERRRGAGELGLGRLAGLRRRESAPRPRWVRVEVGRAEERRGADLCGLGRRRRWAAARRGKRAA